MKKIVSLILLSCITLISVAQVVVDPKGTRVAMDSSKWKISGNDINNKNTGNVGIGTSNPAYKLDVSAAANPVRIMGVQNGSTTDSVVTIVNGVIKKIAAASFNKNDSTTASNGLNINGLDVQLGGNLTQATTITNNSHALTIATGGSALNITGLTAGTESDSILTINISTGKINRVNRSVVTGDVTTASNGLTELGSDIQLGGSLTKATVLTTSSTNTLALKGLQTSTAGSDSLLMITSGGAIRKLAQTDMINEAMSATNGLTLSGTNIRLGGTLITPTTITTTGTNTLAIAGLQSGVSTDSIVVANPSTGLLKRIAQKTLLREDSTTASNGLTLSGLDVQLGGT
ncbi:MAG: hypothetical protein WCI49_06990, partial [Ferruginibacter sp.]